MRLFALQRTAQLALSVTLAYGALACGADTDHGPTIGSPTGPIGPVVVEAGTSSVGGQGGNSNNGTTVPGSGGTFNNGSGGSGVFGTAGNGIVGNAGNGTGNTDPFGIGGSPTSPFGAGGFF
ncbi:MAG TPA: hypothetical protein VGC79_15830 [Polyangiaceae bacterium]